MLSSFNSALIYKELHARKRLDLLRACLDENALSVKISWGNWKAAQDFDDISNESSQLMPLLMTQLRKYEINDQNIGRYYGLYRRSWVLNTQYLLQILPLLKTLSKENVRFMIVGDLALKSLYFNDSSIRQANMCNVLVRVKDMKIATRVLIANNWIPLTNKVITKLLNSDNYGASTLIFVNSGHQVCLSWSLIEFPLSEEIESNIWDSTQTFHLKEFEVGTLGNEYQLYFIFRQAVNKYSYSLAWVSDSIYLLRATGPFDWDKFLILLETLQSTTLMIQYLYYLKEFDNSIIPDWVIIRLNVGPIKYADFIEMKSFADQNRLYKLYYKYIVSYTKEKNISSLYNSGNFLKGYWKFLSNKLALRDS